MKSRSLFIPSQGLCVALLSAGVLGGQGVADSGSESAPSSTPSTRPARVEQAQSVVRRYSLAGVAPNYEEEGVSQQLFVIPGRPGNWFDDGGAGPLDRMPSRDLDSVADLLSQALGDDLRFEGRGLSVSEEGEMLLVAPPDVHGKAEAILEGLRGALAAHALVSIDILNLEGGNLPFPDQAGLDDAAAERLIALALERGARHVRHELDLTPGNTSISDMTHPVPLLSDFDVEIAQSSGIWDPIRSMIDVGQRVVMRGVPVGDTVDIAVVLRVADLVGNVRERPLAAELLLASEKSGARYVPGPQSLQQAEVMQHSYAFAGRVGGGRALLCASDYNVGGSQRTQLVVIRALEVQGQRVSITPLGSAGRSLMVVNKEAFAPPGVATELYDDDWIDDVKGTVLLPAGRMTTEVPSVLEEMLSFQFNLLRDTGPWALIVTDPAWDRAGADDLRSLGESWPKVRETASVTLTLSASGVGDAVPVRVLMPCRRGQESAVLVGTATNVIWDYDVEVAQNAALADPVIGIRFSGLGAILGTAGETTELEATCLARIPAEAPRVLEVGASEFRFFDRQVHDVLTVRDRKDLGPDGSVRFGTRATGAREQSLELQVSVH